MSRFKRGDEVVAIAPCDYQSGFVGKTGRVVKIRRSDIHRLPVLVYFNESPMEWTDEWWCEESSLKLLGDDEDEDLYV